MEYAMSMRERDADKKDEEIGPNGKQESTRSYGAAVYGVAGSSSKGSEYMCDSKVGDEEQSVSRQNNERWKKAQDMEIDVMARNVAAATSNTEGSSGGNMDRAATAMESNSAGMQVTLSEANTSVQVMASDAHEPVDQVENEARNFLAHAGKKLSESDSMRRKQHDGLQLAEGQGALIVSNVSDTSETGNTCLIDEQFVLEKMMYATFVQYLCYMNISFVCFY